MADFNSKYSGKQIEDLLDQIASGNGGGGGDIPVISQGTYIAPFTVDDVASLYNGDLATLSIPIAMIEAVIAKKRVLIPSNYDLGDGFAELIHTEGYVSDTSAGVVAFFFRMREMYSIYVDNTIVGDAIVTDKECIDKIVIPEVSTSVGISSIEQTTTSNADGGSNVVTVTLTDGSTSTFTIKNGSKGSQGVQGEQGPKGDTGATGAQGPKGDKGDKGDTGAAGTNGKDGADGADGEDGATFTPSVDSAGNLSWSNNKGLANPPTVNIKGPKGDKGDAGEGGGGSSGGGDNSVETLDFEGDADFVISELLPNKKYVVYASYYSNTPSLTISSLGGNLSEEESTIDSFYALIYTDHHDPIGSETDIELSLYLPDDGEWHWANNKVTQMKLYKTYEMSIIRHNNYGYHRYFITIAEYS